MAITNEASALHFGFKWGVLIWIKLPASAQTAFHALRSRERHASILGDILLVSQLTYLLAVKMAAPEQACLCSSTACKHTPCLSSFDSL